MLYGSYSKFKERNEQVSKKLNGIFDVNDTYTLFSKLIVPLAASAWFLVIVGIVIGQLVFDAVSLVLFIAVAIVGSIAVAGAMIFATAYHLFRYSWFVMTRSLSK